MSSKEWKRYKLGEIVDDIAMGPFGSNIKVDNFIDQGVPVIRGSNLNEGGLTDEKFVFVSEEKAASLKRSLAYPDDLVFTHRGTIGQVGIIPHGKHPKYLVSQSQMKLTVNKKYLNPRYLYYFFKSSTGQYELLKNASQVGVPAIASPTTSLKEIDITLPSLSAQHRIAATLSTLDDKIELNRQTNATLEAVAQAIFKEWFVEFRFPGATGETQKSALGIIPQGWQEYKLEELIDSVSITHKFNDNKIVFLNTSDIEDGKILHHDYISVEGLPGQAKKSIKKLDILFTEIRPANKRFALIDFDADNYVVSTKLMVLRAKAHVHPIVIYNFITSSEILNELQHLAESRSGTFPQITFSQVKELRLALPQNTLLEKYTSLAWSSFQQIKTNEQQSITLAQIRDSLLPKFMNGEIEV